MDKRQVTKMKRGSISKKQQPDNRDTLPRFNGLTILFIIFTHLIALFAGFIINFSGMLESIVKLPANYHDLKKTYLYDEDFLKGTWSTNTEYLIGSVEKGLDFEQPKTVLTIEVDKDGRIDGEILNEKLCDALPLTWEISLRSDPPNLLNFFINRTFYIKQRHNGDMEKVSELKLIHEDNHLQTLTFKTISDETGSLPQIIKFGKGLPSYDSDFKYLSKYCADSPKRFIDSCRKPSREKTKGRIDVKDLHFCD